MDRNPLKPAFPWLIAGLLTLLASLVLYLVDISRSDASVIHQVNEAIQRDFNACVRYYQSGGERSEKAPVPGCQACELTYNRNGRLQEWTHTEWLPDLEWINRLRSLPGGQLVNLDNRSYFQIRQDLEDGKRVFLIPIRIDYAVNNDFLVPYTFLGRFQSRLDDQVKGGLSISWDDTGQIIIRDALDVPLFSLRDLPVASVKRSIRMAVLWLLLAGSIILGVFLRIYAIHRWRYRYRINGVLFLAVILLRVLLWLTDLPQSYVESDIFSAQVMSFHWLAPSLGEFTINVVTLFSLVFIGYTHFFRLSQIWFSRFFRRFNIAGWAIMGVNLLVTFGLLVLYENIFEQLAANIEVDINFTNLFRASDYAYLVLLDMGLLLFTFFLVGLLLLRLNMSVGERSGYPPFFWVFHGVLLVAIPLIQNGGLFPQVIIQVLAVALLVLVLQRSSGQPVLRQDLPGILLLLLALSLPLTFGVISGSHLRDQQKVEQIAIRVLGSQSGNTAFSFENAISQLLGDQSFIRDRLQGQNPGDFEVWLRRNYLEPSFKGYSVRLFLFDEFGNALNPDREETTVFSPRSEIRLEDRGFEIAPGLYQLPATDNRYLDMYVGHSSMILDSATNLNLVIELLPKRLETERLYPALTMDQAVYNDLKLIRAYDHAIYQDGFLYLERSETSFPVYVPEYREVLHRFYRSGKGYREFVQPVSGGKVVVVRYKLQDWFQIISSFSFVFYFMVVLATLMFGLPLFLLRSLKMGRLLFPQRLQEKMRLGLLGLSLLPLIAIVVLLSPFIEDRYYRQARHELSEELAHITELVKDDFLLISRLAIDRRNLAGELAAELKSLEDVLPYDINVFDRLGRRLASTRPLIFEIGIDSDLMDAQAFEVLKTGGQAEMMLNEQLGDLEYLSGYRSIIGAGREPVGYVNIPYLTRQDQLQSEMVEFLAYLANIYLLVFLLINLLAVLLSDALTRPLVLLRQRLRNLRLGNRNETIEYQSDDEIGDIVRAYNDMVEQLAESETRLAQSQREMAWKQMARQVAHEIKNPLTPMRLRVQQLKKAWEESETRFRTVFPRTMEMMLDQIDSLVRIARSFSEFARMPDPERSYFILNELLASTLELYTDDSGIDWQLRLPERQVWVHADREQLARCISNLIKNAAQAVDGAGQVSVSMEQIGKKVRVAVIDDGPGVPFEIQDRIFEPNFSTKSSGMGMGLAIVKQIVENAGGEIKFKTRPGMGTVFYLDLPVATPKIEEIPAPAPQTEVQS